MPFPVLTKDLRQQLEATDDRPTETVEIPEWGVSVIMRGLSAGDQLAYTNSIVDYAADGSVSKVNADGVFRLIAMSMVDESGGMVFDDIEAGAAVLQMKSAASITKLAAIAARLSAIGGAEVEALKNASGPVPVVA